MRRPQERRSPDLRDSNTDAEQVLNPSRIHGQTPRYRKNPRVGAFAQHTNEAVMIAFLRRIWHFVKPYRMRLFTGLLCGILFALTNTALILSIKVAANLVFAAPGTISPVEELRRSTPFAAHLPFLRQFIDSLAPLLSSKLGAALMLVMLPLVMFLRGLFGYLNVYLMGWASLRAVTDIRAAVFAHVQDLPLQFFSGAKTGDLISRLSNDSWVLTSIISNSFVSIVKDPLTVVGLLSCLLWQQPKLTLIAMLVFPVCVIPISIYGRKVRRSSQATQAHLAEMTTVMHEAFTGARVIKAYNLEAQVRKQFKETAGRIVSQMMRMMRSYEIPSQLMEFLGAVGVTLVFLYLRFLSDQPMGAGDLLGFVTAFFLMYQPIKSMTRLNSQLEQARAASDRIFELLDTPSTVVDPTHPKPLRASGASIHFRGIQFAYKEKPVLQGIELLIKPGQLVALVGSSGSGKTTITNLLLRFYDPLQGAVLIGDTDIRSAAIKDLRAQIALVAQETILFNDTIRSNIELGRPGATAAEIEAAARHAYAHEFIMEKLEHGYDTIVGEKGVALSGGQRQRISIARAILRNAPILVLDEATSSLDTEAERAVQSALEELMRGRTTICIAHRLSTIQNADVIVVLDQGRIVERGTHAELVKQGGVYQKLYELQFQS